MSRAFWEWLLCFTGIHVGWPELSRRTSLGFECRRCKHTIWLRKGKTR